MQKKCVENAACQSWRQNKRLCLLEGSKPKYVGTAVCVYKVYKLGVGPCRGATSLLKIREKGGVVGV
jgi:hypothetical protein